MNKGTSTLTVLLLFALKFSCFQAQIAPKVKYWVSFNTKSGTNYTLTKPEVFLTQKSIQRRLTYNIPLHSSDLPVNPAYIAALNNVKSVKVIYASKWLNGAVIAIDSASVEYEALGAVNTFSFVVKTKSVRKFKLDLEPTPDSLITYLGKGTSTNTLSPYPYGGSRGQIKQMSLDCLHDKGYRGQGITIAVMDVGFDNVDSSPLFDSIRNSGGILGGADFVEGGTNPYRGGSHGTLCFSTLAANKPNLVMGTAPMAKYWLMRTEDGATEKLIEEYNWVRAAEFADSVGVDMITTSLGYTTFDSPSQNHTYATLNGRTAPMSIAANMAARKGIFVVNSAGNSGADVWKYVGVPADADSICTVGAVDSNNVYASFSSVGPTPDGRIKPDLVATGFNAWVCSPSSICFPGSGTSFSGPIIAGGIACYWQAHKNLNNIELLNELKKTASNANAPNNKTGWGVPKLCRRDVSFDFNLNYDQSAGILKVMLSDTYFDFVTINLYDQQGKLLFSKSVETYVDAVKINLSTAVEGIYLLKLVTSRGTKTKKFYK
jgi:serine protease AprX